jgi:hypothetical protein
MRDAWRHATERAKHGRSTFRDAGKPFAEREFRLTDAPGFGIP